MLTAAALFQLLLISQPAPVERIWIRSRLSSPNIAANVQPIAPDVQDVRIADRFVYIRSAGLSFQSFGPLQAAPLDQNSGIRRFEFRIPRSPTATPSPTPTSVTGVFINGVPIYNPAGALSYQDQDIWHVDSVAFNDDGTLTAAGRPAQVPHPIATPPLLQQLLARNTQHSPIIGYALDGYPIYGPYGQNGARQRSSYQLRKIADRRTLPSGLDLPPAQEGPPIGAMFPLGTFAEDYECVPGSGDLDCHNGRFAITPEYPQGTYAYFVSTNSSGKLTFPYLIGRTYAGAYTPDLPTLTEIDAQQGLTLQASTAHPTAGQPVTWVFETPALEKVHEKPIHLLVVSRDQSLFDHVHPQLITPNRLSLEHTFAQGGHYWLYADFTPAGGSQTIARFPIDVAGPTHPAPPDPAVAPTLTIDGPITTSRDLTFHFDLAKFQGLDRYLGAWAHIIMMSTDGEDFIHAHPKETLPAAPPNPWIHIHDTAAISPNQIETVTGFRRPGQYKIWLQIQKNAQVLTFSYTIHVSGSEAAPLTQSIPANAIRIDVDARGFTPARIALPAGAPIKLLFYRANSQNCASRVVFPSLKIEKELPPNAATLIDLPAQPAGTLTFGCGMGMLRGALVIAQTLQTNR
jgi:hypothetical protein